MPESSHSQGSSTRPRSNARLAILSVVIGSLGALALAEIAVRLLLGYHTPQTVRDHSITYRQTVYAPMLLEPVGRLVDVDNQKAWGGASEEPHSGEGLFISANGYRGPAFDVDKPPGTLRIIVIGGSAVFDQNVNDTADSVSNTWPHRVGALLRERGFEDVEVINAGVPGHTSADSLARFYTQLWTYAPDLVVVYHGWNDIKYWHRHEITPHTPLIDRVAPFDPRDNPLKYYTGPVDRFLAHSQLYVRVRNQFHLRRLQPGAEGAVTDEVPPARDFGAYGPQQWRLNLALIVSASRAVGAQPVLVTQASLIAADNSPEDRARIGLHYQGLDHAAVLRAMTETYRIAKAVGERTDTLVIDAAAQMNGRSEWFSDHVHTTAAGSAQLAHIVADALAPALAAPAQSGESDP